MAYSFTNSTDLIDYGDIACPSGSLTFYAHFLCDLEDSSRRNIISWYGGGIMDLWFEFNDWATNSLAFGFQDSSMGSWPETVWTSGFTAGTIHRVWGIWNGTTQRIYADTDTTHKSTNTPSNPPAVGTTRLNVGNRAAVDRDLEGDLYELAVFNRELSAGERSAMAVGYSAAFFRPYYYMPLIRNSNEVIRSAVGTVSGAAVAAHDRIIYPSKGTSRRFTTASAPATSVKDLIMSGMIPFAR